jgi:DNA-directed RNA polymerase subunit RPC12/RpoP
MNKRIETGWPAIAALAAFVSGLFCGWIYVSGDSPEHFYVQWRVLFWVAGAIVGLCILSELTGLKCPYCRSRAVERSSAEEIDRWLGQKTVNENAFSVGAFQTFGPSKFKGMTEGITVISRAIPVTKRRIREDYRCRTCDRTFERHVVEEMR